MLEYCTCDMIEPTYTKPKMWGLLWYLYSQKKSYEVLIIESAVIPGVYKSIWVKIEVRKGKYKIIGNIYRPNSTPLADL